MTAELTGLVRELTTLQTEAARLALLETLPAGTLARLKAHFDTYESYFPDGARNAALISQIGTTEHGRQSLAVLVHERQLL